MNKILLVDDHAIVRDGLSLYFRSNEEFEIAYQASNGNDAIDVLEKKGDDIDLIITDLSMPYMDGVELVKTLKQKSSFHKIIVLTMINEVHYIKELVSLGVNGYLLKNSTQEEIIEAVRTVISGENYFANSVTKSLIDFMAGRPKAKQRLTLEVPLSKREKEVLKLVVNEQSNQEIANTLFISSRTVETHKRNLLDKTGAKNVAGLVMYAVERDLV